MMPEVMVMPHQMPAVDVTKISDKLVHIVSQYSKEELLTLLSAVSILPKNTQYTTRWELLLYLTKLSSPTNGKTPDESTIVELFEGTSDAEWELVEDFTPVPISFDNWIFYKERKYHYLPGSLEIPHSSIKEIIHRIGFLQEELPKVLDFSVSEELIKILQLHTAIVELIERGGKDSFSEKGGIAIPSAEFLAEYRSILCNTQFPKSLWDEKSTSLPPTNTEALNDLITESPIFNGKPYFINDLLVYFKRRLVALFASKNNSEMEKELSRYCKSKVFESLLEVLPVEAIIPEMEIKGLSANFDFGFIMDRKLFVICVIPDNLVELEAFKKHLTEAINLHEKLHSLIEENKKSFSFCSVHNKENVQEIHDVDDVTFIVITDNFIDKDLAISAKKGTLPYVLDLNTFEYVFEDLFDKKRTPLELWKILRKSTELTNILHQTFADFYDFLSNRDYREEPMLWNKGDIGLLDPHFSSSIQNIRLKKRPLADLNPTDLTHPFIFKVVKGEEGHYLGYNRFLEIKFDCLPTINTYYIIEKLGRDATLQTRNLSNSIRTILLFYLSEILGVEDISKISETDQVVIHITAPEEGMNIESIKSSPTGFVIAEAKDNAQSTQKHFLIVYDEEKYIKAFSDSPSKIATQLLEAIAQKTLSKEKFVDFMKTLSTKDINNQFKLTAAIAYSNMENTLTMPPSELDIVEVEVDIFVAIAGKYAAGVYEKKEASRILIEVVSHLRQRLKKKLAEYNLNDFVKKCYEGVENSMKQRKLAQFSFHSSLGMDMNYDTHKRFEKEISGIDQHSLSCKFLLEQACSWGMSGETEITLSDWQSCAAISQQLVHYSTLAEFFNGLSDIVNVKLEVKKSHGFSFNVILEQNYRDKLIREQIKNAENSEIREITRAKEIGIAPEPTDEEFRDMTKKMSEQFQTKALVKELSEQIKYSFGFTIPEYVAIMVAISRETKNDSDSSIMEIEETVLFAKLCKLTGYEENLIRNVLMFSTLFVSGGAGNDVDSWFTSTRENRIAIKPLIKIDDKFLFGLESLAFAQDNVTSTILEGQWFYNRQYLSPALNEALNKQQKKNATEFETEVFDKLRSLDIDAERNICAHNENDGCMESIIEKCPGEIDVISVEKKRKRVTVWEAKDLLTRYGSREIAWDVNQFVEPKKGILSKLDRKKAFVEKYKSQILNSFGVSDAEGWEISSAVVLSKSTMVKSILDTIFPVMTFNQIENYISET